MPVYGQFETVRVLSHGAIATTETARRVGEADGDDFVIKICRPLPFAAAEDTRRQLADFVEQAETQRAVASTGSHWAPVHDLGTQDDAAFYVTDRFDIHAGQLIQGRVKLGESAMIDILSGAAKGLLELQSKAGRPHGNVKPTNLLISSLGRRGGTTRAVLSDPLPSSRVDRDRDLASDRHALGKLLYGFVTHRQYPGPSSWPIEPDQAWLSMGRNGRRWCELCNALLAPDSEPALPLEEFIERVERLRRRGGVPTWRLVAGLGGGLVLLTVAIIWLLTNRSGPALPFEEKVARICQDGPWLQGVYERFVAFEPSGNTAFNGSPISDFVDLRGKVSRLWESIEPIREQIKTELDWTLDNPQLGGAEGRRLVEQALRTVEPRLSACLAGIETLRGELASWKPNSLIAQADDYRDRGWESGAATLDTLATRSTLPPLPENADWEAFGSSREMALDLAAKDVYRSISTKLEGTLGVFSRVSGELSEAPLDPAIYIALADDADLEQIINNLDRLSQAIEHLGVEPGQPWKLGLLREKLDRIDDSGNREEARRRINALQQQLLSALEEPKGLEDCEQRFQTWTTALAALEMDVGTWQVRVEDKIRDLDDRLQSPTGVTNLRSLLTARWNPELQAFQRQSASAAEGSDEYTQLANAIGNSIVEFEAHRRALAQIEARTDPGALTGIPTRFENQRATIKSVIKAGRWDQLEQIAREISSPERDVDVWTSIDDRLDEWQNGVFAGWLNERMSLLNDYDRIAARLDEAYGLNESLTPDDVTIATLHQKWIANDDMSQIVKGVRDRIRRLEAVDRTNDPGALALDEGERDPAFAMAVWRRHCILTPSPAPTTLIAEQDLLGTVKAVIASVDPARQAELMSDDITPRWLERERQLTDSTAYAALLASRGVYGVEDSGLDSRITFNLAIDDLRRWFDNSGRDESESIQRERIAAFVAATEGQGGADEALQRFRELLSDESSGFDASEIGPAKPMGGDPSTQWVYDQASDLENGILSFTWTSSEGQPHRLTFKRIGSSDSESATYLSIDEVSVGLFRDVLGARAEPGFWDEKTKITNTAVNQQGGLEGSLRIVTWIWDATAQGGERIKSSPGFWVVPPATVGGWTAGFPDPNIVFGQPTDNHPVQRISPAGAVYMAGLIQCRLPTVAEWREAAAPFDETWLTSNAWSSRVGSSSMDEQLPNLRDETWRIQRDHLAEQKSRAAGVLAQNSYSLPEFPENENEAVTWDDRTLWFRETSQDGSKFHNLIGNVAEYVWKDAQSIPREPIDSFDAFYGSLRGFPQDAMYIIGGSSLANSSTMTGESIARLDREFGRSDVGFRLAFQAGPVQLGFGSRLAKLMAPPPFQYASVDSGNP